MVAIGRETVEWLIEGDPAVRWQVERDLLDAAPAVYAKERAWVAEEGWGKRFLDLQDEGGTWAGGIYAPKFTSTHYAAGAAPHRFAAEAAASAGVVRAFAGE